MKNVAINGFGRIGRCVLRAYFENNYSGINISIINSTAPLKDALHSFKYDSIFGKFNGKIEIIDENEVNINGKKIKFISERNVEKINWNEADLVMECTGAFTSIDECKKHLASGAKKVMISAPAKDKAPTVVYGVNNEIMNSKPDIFSIGSCTTNCLAPVAKIIDDNFKIESGFMTTIHSYTGDQNLVDGRHKDLRRGRAGAISMVPTSTGAAKSLSIVLPQLEGKLDGAAIRVPTPNVSVIDLVVNISKPTNKNEVNELFQTYASGSMKGVLGVEFEPLVSCDFIKSVYSSNIDLLETKMVGKNCLRILSWYDNEWGFSCRMLDIAANLC